MPKPAVEKRREGLRLEWEGEVVARQGAYPQARLLIVNDRDDVWTDEQGEYWAIANVLDPGTGKRLPSQGDVGIAGVGRRYELLPGERVPLPVAFAVDLEALEPRRYAIRLRQRARPRLGPEGVLEVMPAKR